MEYKEHDWVYVVGPKRGAESRFWRDSPVYLEFLHKECVVRYYDERDDTCYLVIPETNSFAWIHTKHIMPAIKNTIDSEAFVGRD